MTVTVRSAPLMQARRAWARVGERDRTLVLCLLAVGAVLLPATWPQNFRLAAVETLVLMLGLVMLRSVGILVLSAVIAVIVTIVPIGAERIVITASGMLMLAAVGSAVVFQITRRDRLGLGRVSAESVIGQVQSRLTIQAEVPPLPDTWIVDVQQRPADRAAIAGDFVSSRVHDTGRGPVLELAVVDVSGKGIEAGSRALLLSGAVGGLLGSVEPDALLPEVNSYLLRQRWAAGFATCAYVRVELETGRFEVRAAGHPAPVMRNAAGEWTDCSSVGTLLGVVTDLSCAPYVGRLAPGDLLIVVTDGVIERRDRSIESGIADLRAAADSPADDPLIGLAARLVDTVPADADDDRAVVVIGRPAC